jgi:predicted lipid carrier protein YhbT
VRDDATGDMGTAGDAAKAVALMEGRQNDFTMFFGSI